MAHRDLVILSESQDQGELQFLTFKSNPAKATYHSMPRRARTPAW